jgi:hypothetical protein
MPKIDRDDNLLIKVRALVAKHSGCSAAAKFIGINKATLWRFLNTGAAIERNKAKLRSAVDKPENEPCERKSETSEAGAGARNGLSLDDLERMKSMCQTMILVIESYMASSMKGEDPGSAPDPASVLLNNQAWLRRD